MFLGEYIKQYRSEHNMTMQEFADKASMTKGYVFMLEKNVNPRTGKPITPSVEVFWNVAKATHITVDELAKIVDENQPIAINAISKDNLETASVSDVVMIPVLGKIPAGTPIEAIQEIEGYTPVSREWEESHFALRVRGDSMYPKYQDGDTVIVKCTNSCESGDDCVAYVNGYDATLKKIIINKDCIILQPINPAYEPKVFINSDEVKIAGVVVQIRRDV